MDDEAKARFIGPGSFSLQGEWGKLVRDCAFGAAGILAAVLTAWAQAHLSENTVTTILAQAAAGAIATVLYRWLRSNGAAEAEGSKATSDRAVQPEQS